jgi:hypothetical protein
MNIFFPLVLAVMPTSISVDSFLLVVVAMGAIAAAGLAASRQQADERTLRALAALYAAAAMDSARNGAANDAAIRRCRVEAVATLCAAARSPSCPAQRGGGTARLRGGRGLGRAPSI